MPISINLSVLPESESQAVKAVEVLARAAAGLGFEGIPVTLNILTFEEGEETD